MNKRIKKKIAKREAEQHQDDQLGVAGAFHKLEEDIVNLAHALLSEGREKSSAAVAGVRETIARSEQGLEDLVAKLPGMGPQLAQALHARTHGDEKQQSKGGNPSHS
jgi:hypothetical protein